MEVKILTLTISFVLYQSVVLQELQPPEIISNKHMYVPFNNMHRRPSHLFLNRPSSAAYPDQDINRPNWMTSFPDRFPFNNHQMNMRPMPFHRPMHNHMMNIPSPSPFETSFLEEYFNRRHKPNRPTTLTNPNMNNNMNNPTNVWYRPHGTESSMGVLNPPSNKPWQSQATEGSVVNPSGPITDQEEDMMNHEHHDNTNTFNSNPPKEIHEDISDDSSPNIDIRIASDS